MESRETDKKAWIYMERITKGKRHLNFKKMGRRNLRMTGKLENEKGKREIG